MFSPKKLRAEKPYTVSYEDQEKDGVVFMTHPFIICVNESQFIDKDKKTGFECVVEGVYRIMLPADAKMDALERFEEAIKQLKCADAIEGEYEEYCRPSSSPSLRRY